MFHFLIGFIYILYILLIASDSSSSSSVLSSFNESCSYNFSCTNPLICSNMNRCVCPNSSSFWNDEQNDCLSCLPGGIEWEKNRCISFAVPSAGGRSYNQTDEICHSFSGQLFQIRTIDEFEQFQLQVNRLRDSAWASAVTLFFRLGAWIDGLEGVWCDDDHNDDPTLGCVFIREKKLTSGSLCLSRWNCDEQMLFICDMPAISDKDGFHDDNQRAAALLGALMPMAFDLLGNLFGGNQQPQPSQPNPQTIIIQPDNGLSAGLLAQEESSNNFVLYIILGIGGFIILLIICGICVAIIVCFGCMTSSPLNQQPIQRSSFESSNTYG